MPAFIYYIEKDGKLLQHEVKAKSIQFAKLKLKSRNIEPVYIKLKPLIPLFSGGGGINRSTLLFFTRQLSFLLSSGVPVVRGIEMCISISENERFKIVLKSILNQLEAGKQFSRCLQSRPDIFDGFYINMIICAEKTGHLDKILKDLADYMERIDNITSKVKGAMIYPSIVLLIAGCFITGIIMFVVPKFDALYSGSGGELPALTQSLVSLNHLVSNNIVICSIFIVGLPIVFFQYMKTEGGKKNFRGIIKVIPVFSKIQYHSALVKFCHSFHSLLSAGINFLDALDISHKLADHDDLQRGIFVARDFITRGKSFAKGLETSKTFPPLVYNMAKVGEESGKMDYTFEKLAVYYETHLNSLIDGLIKLIEPLLIVVLGVTIGIIILALYLPVFNMGSIIN